MSEVITDHLDLWTSALLTKSTAGRGSNGKLEAYGIKKLRELILELAVRGKLVPQDPNDEPANVLLKKISVDKDRLIKEKKLRKQASLPRIEKEGAPHELLDGWQWARLGDICTKLTDGSHNPPSDSGEGYPMLSSQNVNNGEIDFNNPSRFVTEEDFEKEDQRTQIAPNDILLTIVASLGRSAVVPIDAPKFVLQRSVAVLQTQLVPHFLALQLVSPHCLRYYDTHGKGTAQKGIYLGKLGLMEIAVPPLTEQHRIVAKVNELMALCDQLEQQQTDSLAAHQTLVETLLGTLTRVESQQEFSAAWTRIANHFDTLFATEASIDQLKQSILQLAVMGKLVPQDPSDEPACVLLEKIAAEKAQLVSAGKISKSKPLPPVAEQEKQFDIPNGWVWTKFDDLALHSEAGWSPNCELTPRQGDNWGVLKVSAVTWGKYDPQENKALPANLEPKPEFEVMPGDFLISRANTAELVARAVVVPNGAPAHLMMSDKIIRFVFAPELDHEYLALVNRSEFSRAYYARVAGGTSSSMKNVSREQIKNLVVALPPLAEQHRIVAKVDELMALCDALKARIADAQTTQLHLADAIVEQAVQ